MPFSGLLPAEHVSGPRHGIDAGDVICDGVDTLLVLLNAPLGFVPKSPVLDPVPVTPEVQTVLLPPLRHPQRLDELRVAHPAMCAIGEIECQVREQ